MNESLMSYEMNLTEIAFTKPPRVGITKLLTYYVSYFPIIFWLKTSPTGVNPYTHVDSFINEILSANIFAETSSQI